MPNARQQYLNDLAEKDRPKQYYGTRIVIGPEVFIYLKSLDKPEITFEPDENKYGFTCKKLVSDTVRTYFRWEDVKTVQVSRHDTRSGEYLVANGGFIIDDLGKGRTFIPEPENIDNDIQVIGLPNFSVKQGREGQPLEGDGGTESSPV